MTDTQLPITPEANTDIPVEGAALATAPEGQQDQNQQTEVELTEAAKKAVGKQHFKFREEERNHSATKKDLDDARAQLAAIEANKPKPEIPDMPDSFDEDFTEKMAARDQAIIAKAQFDTQQGVLVQQQESANQAQADAQAKTVNDAVAVYQSRTTELGLKAEEIDAAANVVAGYVSPEVGMYLLSDADGPLMTKYLADNPLELDALRNMSPMQAAITLNSTVREASQKLKPQQTNTPAPAETLDGGVIPENKGSWLQGGTYS